MNFLTKFFRIDPNMSLPEKEETISKLKERTFKRNFIKEKKNV